MSQQEHLTLSISTLTFSSLFFIHFLRSCLRELVQTSRHFILGDQLIYSHDLNTDQAVLLTGESGCWSLLELKGLIRTSLRSDRCKSLQRRGVSGVGVIIEIARALMTD